MVPSVAESGVATIADAAGVCVCVGEVQDIWIEDDILTFLFECEAHTFDQVKLNLR